MAHATGNCASCGEQTSSSCSRCQDSPGPDTGDTSNMFYCSKVCQRKNWPDHQAKCKARVHRKKLFRTAALIKASFLVYRALEFDLELSKIELRDNILYLYDNQKDLTCPPKRGTFPEHLTTNPEHREAALCWFQCQCALSLASGLIYKLLADVPSQIERLAVSVGNPLLTTQCVPGPDSPNIPSNDSTTMIHSILKVTLLSTRETWILDITGAQYGFKDILIPYSNYMSQCRMVDGPFPYVCTLTWDLDLIDAIVSKDVAKHDTLNAERPARQRFAAFANAVNKDILDGSSKEFEDKVEALKTALKVHMSLGPSV